MSTDTALVAGRQLSLAFGNRQILQDVDITLMAGQIVTLIGPNGAGKTSLVRLVLGLEQPTGGSLRRRPGLRIGYMPQKLHLDPSLPLTVSRFLRLAHNDRAAIAANLALTGVDHLADSSMHHLSGGELQRVLLARALLRDPSLLVLDEPVQGVDVAGQARLYQLIADIRDQRQCGVLMVSHDLHLVMAATDTVICLNQHVCCHGHPDNVSEHPAYLELFGHSATAGIAVYTHHHDHDHDMHGDVTDCDANHCQHKDHHHG
ncbi:zinc ABC transporter ATP-binding protein ZnuC [Pseudomaricurvus sp. HS19]|uniref:zinc ABC transporter ATP-binding protein ZnuC n=1 Tax=Pseudomaricurvus sp. HS19 TaxID=2692626 RepID=UPI0013690240|nr:zinc ABC transporter ATP-binding protein ZnuC [Pseudomaricurvus sp. HS19]MYM63734.1 zinc ABC transporter ATP-binding protein ZnuC [Pseudomaricurvus sp. HS19]